MADAAASSRQRHPLLALLFAGALAVVIAFVGLGLRGNLAFVLSLRAAQLLAIVQVAVAIAVSTVVFQTISANRLISPSIMGMDALYIFGQTGLIFLLGGLGFATIAPQAKFAVEVTAMMALSAAIFLPLLGRRADMMLMILTGVVLGLLFRSLNSLLARIIDPNAFAVAQGASFASFQSLDRGLVLAGAAICILGTVAIWRARHLLDVVALGRDAAVGLGVDWNRTILGLLLVVSALVASATALAGPLAFLGLLVVALAERICGTRRHAILLPAAALVAILVLVGAQLAVRSDIGGSATVSVVVEFFGGLVFLALLFGRRRP